MDTLLSMWPFLLTHFCLGLQLFIPGLPSMAEVSLNDFGKNDRPITISPNNKSANPVRKLRDYPSIIVSVQPALAILNVLLVPHIYVSGLDQHWFRYWLVACSAPSHYLKQCCLIFNETLRNKLQ